jgi:hypothetical protein
MFVYILIIGYYDEITEFRDMSFYFEIVSYY